MTDRSDESLSTRDLTSQSDPTASAVASPKPGAQRSESRISNQGPTQDAEMLAPVQEAEAPAAAQDVHKRPPASEAQTPAPVEERPESRQPSGEAEERPESGQPSAGAETAVASSPEPIADTAPSPEVETDTSEPLLTSELSVDFQRRWEDVQTRFVDEPRGAVEDADGLVANLMQQLAEGFAQERERLEAQWGRGEDISTEDLRVALKRYRSFFQRLLST